MTLKDIAKQANVSPSTVSLVLHNKPGVSKKTRKHISRMLLENGYNINFEKHDSIQRSIRFLKYSKHSLLVNGNAGFVTAIIDAVEKESRLQGYNLVMTVFGENNIAEVFEMVRKKPLDGIIFLGTELEQKNLVYLRELPVPIVVVDNLLKLENFNCITMNNYESIYTAVKYLVDLGHARIGYLYSTMPSSNCAARRAAFESSMNKLGIHFDPELIYCLHPTLSGSYECTLKLLKSGVSFPPALVANNDSIALGAIKAFKEFGINVPDSISIIGFDDIPFSAIADPPLTTMRVSCKDIGIWTVRLLCDRINYPNAPVAKIQIGTELVVRNSTCEYQKSNKA